MLGIRTKLVPKGTICYGSELRESNRWCPSENKQGIFNSDAVVRPLKWASDKKNFTAVFVRQVFISNLELVSDRDDVVVWVPSESIQKW
tara:strand:- start:1948 stop:2214 length:267 start_codon:yes stop_codon:yes gene_type:complete